MTRKSSSRVKKQAPAPKRAPDLEPADDMPPTADDAAAEMLDSAVKNTPWWALSLAFHGCVLASLPLIVFSQALLAAPQDTPVIIQVNKPQKALIKEITASDLRASRPIAGDLSPTPAEVPDIKFPPDFVESDRFSDGLDPSREEGVRGDLDGTNIYDGVGDGWGRKTGPGKGPEVIGAGPGGGGGKKFGTGPFSGRHKTFIRSRSGRSGSAIEHGLYWLARHQHEDGHWSTEGYHARCGGEGARCTGTGLSDFDVGNTGLALLAFLGAGYTPSQRSIYRDPVTQKEVNVGEVVRKGMKWLIEKQSADGAIGPQVGEMMYNHSIAALALSEAYGLTSAASYRGPAQKAINFIVTAQNYGLGWRYTPRCGNNDTSVTGWCVMALKSAQISNLEVPQTSFVGAKAWLDRVTDSSGRHGYDRLGSGDIYAPGKNEKWQQHPSMTAVGLLCRIFIDKKQGDRVLADAAKIIMSDLPRWDPSGPKPSVDYYYWYYATLAIFQLDGGENGKGLWTTWSKTVESVLCSHQRTSKDGCQDGSWDTENVNRWAYAGGRVYGTAINVLTLETNFRYEAVFGSQKRGK
jgi:hypothetical protein